MGIRWIVNAVLLGIPVGVTTGVLIGVDSIKRSQGQATLFEGNIEDPIAGAGGGGGGGETVYPDNDKVTNERHCEQYATVIPPSKGTQYMLSTNAWGWTEGTPGGLCLNVNANNNGSYATDTTAPPFFITWQYPPGPATQPVHAFPNAQIYKKGLPLPINRITSLALDVAWTYSVGDAPAATTDVAALTAALANTNVAFDMFLDADRAGSEDSTSAQYEVMVWLARFGAGSEPIGLAAGVVDTQVVNGTEFSLYTGSNSQNQTVLTWAVTDNIPTFTGDILPLLARLSSLPLPGGITFSPSLYMGHIALGTEAFSSSANVTFGVEKLSIGLVTA
ncbi:xyloglucan-specific endoglucanase [Drepanopeziza brunnea f. sp. 'multigermtubi' MB_m1]|uniref:Xyloglucan-specific endoglucanase n=1 Tax=Marssonina brunnea f. sp. multigermtubi (strain MB_m1) TaxID=1072389 RepID=K1X100_MARBU|nr:xyloglucan-specific endoglucanase [Drepanopeziza brunnea f. sp. 'multigermtubi' MB_m1]EKD18906.1 xyloglucan-specific endoglucanase [Drepanopeziza brunnea f. sp. 'multigermtubi' MB_m1]